MTILENKFMQQVPWLLNEIHKELVALRTEVSELKEELKKKNEE